MLGNTTTVNNDITPREKTSKDIKLYKKIILFVIGLFGLQLLGLLAAQIVKATFAEPNSPEGYGALNFITYAMLFVVLLGIVNIDVLYLKNDFKVWKGYLFGLAFGAGMIIFPIIYNFIIGLFYTPEINENESALRSFITVYPFLSIIFLGLVGPFCEELTYRVGLFGIFVNNKKYKWIGYVVAVLVFGFAHFSFTSTNIVNEFVNLPVYLLSGFLLALAYDKFGFSCSYTAHTINNLYSVVILILANLLNSWAN